MSLNDRWHSDNLYNCSSIASTMDGGKSKVNSKNLDLDSESIKDIKSVMKKNRELKNELNECKEELIKVKLQLKILISKK